MTYACWKSHVDTRDHEGGEESICFAQNDGWIPPADGRVFPWERIPDLAEEYAQTYIDSYFPIFAVNEDLAKSLDVNPNKLSIRNETPSQS